jgi:hypothetical protein
MPGPGHSASRRSASVVEIIIYTEFYQIGTYVGQQLNITFPTIPTNTEGPFNIIQT